jgi:DHA2 family multidrug resistance protein-like MFS transporter
LAALGFALLIPIGVTSLFSVVAGLMIMSLGFGMMFTISTDLVVGSAPPERAGSASALAETGAELGGAMGIAVLGSLGMAVYRHQVAATLPPDVPPAAAAAAQDTLGSVVALVGRLPDASGAALLEVARVAFAQALRLNAGIATVVLAGLAVLAAIVLRDARMGGEPDSHPQETQTVEHAPAQPSSDRSLSDDQDRAARRAYGN